MLNIDKNLFADLEYLGSAEGYVDNVSGVIEHIKLFEDFSLDEIKALCFYMNCYRAPANYTLLEEGATGDFLLLILKGSVRVDKFIFKQGIREIAEVGVGEVLGEMSLIDGRLRFASCTSIDTLEFAVLNHDALNEILIHHPRIGNKFLLVLLQLMAARLRDTCDRILPSVYGLVV